MKIIYSLVIVLAALAGCSKETNIERLSKNKTDPAVLLKEHACTPTEKTKCPETQAAPPAPKKDSDKLKLVDPSSLLK